MRLTKVLRIGRTLAAYSRCGSENASPRVLIPMAGVFGRDGPQSKWRTSARRRIAHAKRQRQLCREQRPADSKRWYEAHREQVLARLKRYHDENRDRLNEERRKRRRAQKEAAAKPEAAE